MWVQLNSAGRGAKTWRYSNRAEGLAAGFASIPALPTMLGLQESMLGDITVVWFPKVTTSGVRTTPLPAYLTNHTALIRFSIA
jgi:hypothetical protein